MKRREMIRGSVLAGAFAAALRPALANAQSGAQSAAQTSELTPAQKGVDASKDLSAPGWKPIFLDEHQNETLIVLSDLLFLQRTLPARRKR